MTYLTLVDGFYPEAPSGAPRVAWDLARAFAGKGYDAWLVCFSQKASSAPLVDTIEGVNVLRLERPESGPLAVRLGASMRERLRSGMREAGLFGQHWDVVHVHSPFMHAAVAGCIERCGRTVYTMHSPIWPELSGRWRHDGLVGWLKRLFAKQFLLRTEGAALNWAAVVHCLSQFTKGQIADLYGDKLLDKVHVLPHWVAPDQRRTLSKAEARVRLGWPVDKRLIFTLRGHKPRTGVAVSIESMAPLVRNGECIFVVGGSGPLLPKHRKLAGTLGCSEQQILFTGRLTDEQVGLAYQAADLFLLPTVELECFGLIIIEAASFGCPVLATDVGSIPEVVKSLGAMPLVPPGNPEAMRRAVKQWLAGELPLPSQAELSQRAHSVYGFETVFAKIVEAIDPSPASSNRLFYRA